MKTLCKIDGKNFDVLVVAIGEAAEIVEGENSGTSLDNDREIRDLKGIKYKHSITFAPDLDMETYEQLWEYLFGSLRESVMLEVVHGQTTISYEAAYNTGSRQVAYIDDKEDVTGWAELTVEFRSIKAVIS